MPIENAPVLMNADEFQKMFSSALTDKQFQQDLMTTGIQAATKRGFNIQIAPEINAQLMAAARPAVAGGAYKCGLCGVCGVCGLCAEINLGSASAALWATFALAETPPIPVTPVIANLK